MADGFMIASECAVWWAEQRDKFKEKLDAYVMLHPDWFGILVAGGGGTLADFGYAFFIDVLKLGEGTAEGSPWGIVQDIGRALSIIPTTRIL